MHRPLRHDQGPGEGLFLTIWELSVNLTISMTIAGRWT
jgi:hypothetical protein